MLDAQKSNLNGWFPVISALLLLSFWILFAVFLPMQEEYLNWVLDEDWTWINIIGFIGSTFGIFALMAIFSVLPGRNKLHYLAFGIGLTGIVILTSILFFEAFILKGIALENSELINLSKGFYQYPIFNLVNLSGGIFLTLGFIVLGFRMLQLQSFKRWKLILLMISCPLFGIVTMPGNLRLIGVLLYAISLIGIGSEMIKNVEGNNK